MNQYRFEQAARRRRNKALVITIVFHLGLLAAIGPKGGLTRMLPSAFRQLFGMEQAPAPEVQAGEEEVARP